MIQLLYNQRKTECRGHITEKDLDCGIYTFINMYRYYRYLDLTQIFYARFLPLNTTVFVTTCTLQPCRNSMSSPLDMIGPTKESYGIKSC